MTCSCPSIPNSPSTSAAFGHHILTFQGHPEFTVEYERHLILNHAENEDEAVKQRALETLGTMRPQGRTVAEFVMGFF